MVWGSSSFRGSPCSRSMKIKGLGMGRLYYLTACRVLATSGGKRAHPALWFSTVHSLILSLNTQHSSLNICKINESVYFVNISLKLHLALKFAYFEHCLINSSVLIFFLICFVLFLFLFCWSTQVWCCTHFIQYSNTP